jgi:Uma2 family endonuclease
MAIRAGAHVEAGDLGLMLHAPVDVMLTPNNILQPDIVFVARKRLAIVQEAYIAGPPDLVVEILSPSTEATDRDAKAKIYARNGVRWYWIADPAAKVVEEYRLVGNGWQLEGRHGEVFTPGIFPALAVDVTRIFRP